MYIGGIAVSSPWHAQYNGKSPISRIGALRPVGGERTDTVTLSPAAKHRQYIEVLNNQRKGLVEQKNALIASALEKGLDMDAIEAQVEVFDEQMLSIDETIAQMSAMQQQAILERQKTEAPEKDPEELTEEEAEAERTAALTETAGGMEQVKLHSAVSDRLNAAADGLEGQAKLDGQRLVKAVKPGDRAASREYLATKRGRASELRARAAEAYAGTARSLNEAQESTQRLAEAYPGEQAKREKDAERLGWETQPLGHIDISA